MADPESTTEYSEDVLGLDFSRQFEGDDGVINYFVAGESETEVQFKHDPAADSAVSPSGFAHTASTVDLEATLAAVEHSVGTVTAGPLDH